MNHAPKRSCRTYLAVAISVCTGAASLAGCGGGSGTSHVFDGSSLENRPVVAEWTGDYNQALIDEFKSCGVKGNIPKYIDEHRLLNDRFGYVNDDGSRTIEISEPNQFGDLVPVRRITVATVLLPREVQAKINASSPALAYEIACKTA